MTLKYLAVITTFALAVASTSSANPGLAPERIDRIVVTSGEQAIHFKGGPDFDALKKIILASLATPAVSNDLKSQSRYELALIADEHTETHLLGDGWLRTRDSSHPIASADFAKMVHIIESRSRSDSLR